MILDHSKIASTPKLREFGSSVPTSYLQPFMPQLCGLAQAAR